MKYAALVLNCVAAVLLGWVSYGLVQLAQANSSTARSPVLELPPLSPQLAPEQRMMADAFNAISRLQAQGVTAGTPAQHLIAMPAPGRPIEGSVQMPARSMSLYLENVDTQAGTVVIDGRLLRNGAPLDDGGRIAGVRPHEVVISERVGRQRLSLPTGELRVGTLRWPDGSLASVNRQEFNASVRGSPAGPVRFVP